MAPRRRSTSAAAADYELIDQVTNYESLSSDKISPRPSRKYEDGPERGSRQLGEPKETASLGYARGDWKRGSA